MKNKFNVSIILILGLYISSTGLTIAQIKQKQRDPKYTYTKSKVAELHFKEGLTAFLNKNLQGAVQSYRSALALDSGYVVALDNLGMSYSNLQMLDSAVYFFRKSVKLYPDGVFAMISLAKIYSKKNKHTEALRAITQALKVDPNLSEAYYTLAGELLIVKEPKLALPYALKSMELYSREKNGQFYGHAAYQTGLCYSMLKDTINANLFFNIAKRNGAIKSTKEF